MGKTVCTVVARSLVLCATVAAVIVMVLDKETKHLDSYTFQPKFTDWGSLRYFVVVNAITCCYSFLVLLLPSGSLLWRPVAVLDVVVTVLIVTGGTVGGDTAYHMKNGNSHAGWQPYCRPISAYCDRVIGALAACCFGALLQLLLTLYTFNLVVNPLLVKYEI